MATKLLVEPSDDPDGFAGSAGKMVFWKTGRDKKKRWLVTVWVERGSALTRFAERVASDQGPFPNYEAAYEWGRTRAHEWCRIHGVPGYA